MNKQQIFLIVIFLDFLALTVWSIVEPGGIVPALEGLFAAPFGWQVFTDLVIALSFVLVWMYRDAKARGTAFWPYAVLTLCAGSFGPLTYFIVRQGAPARSPVPVAA